MVFVVVRLRRKISRSAKQLEFGKIGPFEENVRGCDDVPHDNTSTATRAPDERNDGGVIVALAGGDPSVCRDVSEVSTFVVTPMGIAVMVEVIPAPDTSLLLDEDVGSGTSVSAGNSREVVLPSTRRILTRQGRLTLFRW